MKTVVAMRLASVAVVAFLSVVLFPGVAFAHAELKQSDPANAAVLKTSPERISLKFNEPVEVSLGGVRLYDANANRVDLGRAKHGSEGNSTITVPTPVLRDGTYVVAWRVTSTDSHPIRGAFTFQVGTGAAQNTDALASQLLSDSGASKTVGVAYAIDRFVLFASIVAFVGGLFFVLWIWFGAIRFPLTRRILNIAGGVAAVATVLAIGLQGIYAAALPLSSMFDPSVYREVLDTRYGRAAIGRLVALAAVAFILRWLYRRSDNENSPRTRVLLTIAGLGVIVPSSVTGHAATDLRPLVTVTADAVHFAAAAFWLGGLFLVGCVLLRKATEEEATKIVPRFSEAAFNAVLLIVVTGSYRAYREVGSLDGLTSTTYGRVLMVKLAFFAALIGGAALSRRWVREKSVNRLKRSVFWETAIATVVLAVTALLVNTAPTNPSAENQVFTAELTNPGIVVDVSVDPASQGPTLMHFYVLEPNGATKDVAEFQAFLRLPDKDLGPLPVPLVRATGWHYVSQDFQIPLSGDWELQVIARTSEVDEAQMSTNLPVR